ncbi:MAG: BamA/TamA family outer membrane protein [Pedobacter sp.]|nr:BamA/TamA family outer membrane protein [Pedobacter sp.]
MPRGTDSAKKDTIAAQYDIADLFTEIFHPNKTVDPNRKSSGIIIIPNVAYNPSIGAQIGIKAIVGKILGDEPNTLMSVAATSASITTKGILYFYLNHNIYTPANTYNLQGSLVAAKTVTPDFGLGIGNAAIGSAADLALSNPDRKGYVLHAEYYSFKEKIYKQVYENLFVGAGASFDIRKNIEDRISKNELTPYTIYSDRYGFDRTHYQSNGLLFNFQYTTRDNQNRAYKGIYADAGIRINQTWLGSSKNAVQFTTDFRKYWSLSSNNPEHVIAFWNWGSYLLSGVLPYLELPGTGKDAYFRSGRGYTVGYFKAPQYFYSELEHRFPITRNNFLSGVTFFNIQTANDMQGTKLFERWQPGGGAGLRVLFNKETRTNLCLDYAFGKYGAKGFFLGITEVF